LVLKGFNSYVARSIAFYRPGKRFPAFSVTGSRCELQCDHCRGRYLKGMRPLAGPEDLERAAAELVSAGGTGFLLSGGCDKKGRVPLSPYLGAVRRIKDRTDLKINLHTGLLDANEASALLESGADAFSVDFLQDRNTIRNVLHLEASPFDYERTLRLLSPSGRLVPHVCVGLQSEEGERATLEALSEVKISSLIVLALVPSKGTPLSYATVDPRRVARFISAATQRLDAPVLLGCMRPRADRWIELEAIEAGAAGIVNPSSAAVELALAKGLKIEEKEECCAVHL
jgi:uncharacterized radical SAM superfamily protein